MFGSYRLNERKEGAAPRLSLALDGNELNFYNCSVKILTKEELAALDPTSDILNPLFDGKRALAALRSYKGIVADVLLDQDIFQG